MCALQAGQRPDANSSDSGSDSGMDSGNDDDRPDANRSDGIASADEEVAGPSDARQLAPSSLPQVGLGI